MNVLVTGADDIWGYLTAEQILRRGMLKNSANALRPVERVILLCHKGPYLPDILQDARCEVVLGSITDAAATEAVILDHAIDSIFHFETLVCDRGDGEQAFDEMLNVNLQGSLNLMNGCKKSGRVPKMVFCASCSVFQDFSAKPVSEKSRRFPSTTYGSTKACVELLLSNFTRRGFLDGRNSLLPMCVSWKPTPQDTDFMNNVFRAPFDGSDVVTPLHPDTRLYFNGYYSDILNLIETHDIPSAELGEERSLIQPGISCTVQEMYDMFVQVGAREGCKVGKLVEAWDPDVQAGLDGFCKYADFSRAEQFGLTQETLEQVVTRYLHDYLALRHC